MKETVYVRGEIYPVEEFFNMCRDFECMDLDGFGQYSNGNYIFSDTIWPSDVVLGKIRIGEFPCQYTHVVWFKKEITEIK